MVILSNTSDESYSTIVMMVMMVSWIHQWVRPKVATASVVHMIELCCSLWWAMRGICAIGYHWCLCHARARRDVHVTIDVKTLKRTQIVLRPNEDVFKSYFGRRPIVPCPHRPLGNAVTRPEGGRPFQWIAPAAQLWAPHRIGPRAATKASAPKRMTGLGVGVSRCMIWGHTMGESQG